MAKDNYFIKGICLAMFFFSSACAQHSDSRFNEIREADSIRTGAEQTALYLSKLRNKKVALVANQTSLIANTHLVDTLSALGIKIQCVFAPEHGFRGEAAAGETVKGGVDPQTGVRVISLYGKKKKPAADDLASVDLVVFDIQDVGARFYTYISTLQYVMEACAIQKIPVLILDRPNPNGFYIDGPVLEPKFKSFVGMNPIPVVHGLTMGEYALMLNGEKWLQDSVQCKIEVVKCLNYDHSMFYKLPVKPSPNLPNMAAVYLYPSLCFFEGTKVSVGRGTSFPFQVIGLPGFREGDFSFTPVRIPGVAENPPYQNEECRGFDLREFGIEFMPSYRGIYLFWLKSFYETSVNKTAFFNSFFNSLAGNEQLQQQVKDGFSEEDIRNSWKPGIEKYKVIRKKYLLYPDFEE